MKVTTFISMICYYVLIFLSWRYKKKRTVNKKALKKTTGISHKRSNTKNVAEKPTYNWITLYLVQGA
ncbi:hypothetical protein FUAX_47160 (plasmid) [Fulvitalea axinellae]|uniref:Uncharacterized protein n=1 Tax=Fulvitalea axinellae TaxID=1182444 RepID=A0AAU9CJI7_9BACT|nr:hypothetical protein FUAX_47160 [Fulvitalea axinellae]